MKTHVFSETRHYGTGQVTVPESSFLFLYTHPFTHSSGLILSFYKS